MYSDDMEFLAELKANGLNAELVTPQPANSPDTNLLDLVFHVVQSANDFNMYIT